MDEVARHADAFKTNLSSCSVAAQEYIKDANKAGKSTEQISAGLKDVARSSYKASFRHLAPYACGNADRRKSNRFCR